MCKSQSARLPGHVDEQGSSMNKFIAWKSSGDTTAGWGNRSHSQNGSSLVQRQQKVLLVKRTLAPFFS